MCASRARLVVASESEASVPALAAPLAYEPFSTLAMIYEDDEDVEKALQFGLIAAHLNPSDSEEWIRLAEMSLEQDNIRQAVVCYTKGQCDTRIHRKLTCGICIYMEVDRYSK